MKRLSFLLAFGLAQSSSLQAGSDINNTDFAARAAGSWVAPAETFTVASGLSATIRRSASITPTSESLKVEAFMDSQMTKPLLTYDSGGPMKVVGPWEAVPGAFAVELLNERATVTAHVEAPEIWAATNLGNCSLVVGKAVDIRGCASGPPFGVVDCVDLDLILLDDEATALRFGTPGTDRCIERPTSASELVFVRQ